MTEKEMSVYEHIGELRKRLIYVVVFFFLAMVGGFFLAEPIIVYLQNADEAKELTMNAFRLTDPIKIYMQFAFIVAFVITSPIILFQFWSFISPGLYEKERKVTLSYIPISVLLFLAGISFSYFILFPFVVDFMGRLAERLAINQVIGINEYFQFLLQLTLPFGLLFQLPVIVMFLTRLGIVTPMYLIKVRKYAYFILLVIGAFITPPEIISHMMVTIPLFGLYEISIIVSKGAYRKAKRAEMLQQNDHYQQK
ncbi:twin-arginine translocase subunit TatC [Cytobacillus sp. S13-E01]|uniref:twin-arginine translocase subunit TatC n=1 Tax=Cytobacillus sp. S13-E01 TaxID=3031326 RepID=UPI0023D85069|nr:twin-arginine translocase subunit TatC [Cytobacillus sp. S13-E01]MDF0728717.1 twin-arginine translocase subunit TatC [Cytobacillus sp. S13-E01]